MKTPNLNQFIAVAGSLVTISMPLESYAAAQAQEDAANTEEISVTGALSTGKAALENSTRVHSTTHVEVVSSQQLIATGQTNILAALAQVMPSISSPPAAGIGNNNLGRIMILRNLGPDETLILVNGKRRHLGANFSSGAGPATGSDPADISLIPLSAIDHIEIISDGATALYGQEAIGGAVNIVLKSEMNHGSFNLQDSGYYAGDGVGIDGYGDYGWALGHHGGFIDIAGQISHQQPTVRSGENTQTKYFALANGQPNPQNAVLGNNVNRIQGVNQSMLETFSVNASLPLSDNVSLYNTTTYSHRDTKIPGFFRIPSNDANIRAIYPNGYTPFLTYAENDFQINGGLRGRSLLGWSWDTYALYGRDDLRSGALNTVSPTFGDNSQTTFYNGSFITSNLTAGFKLSRNLNTPWLAKPLGIEFGGEYRHDTYQHTSGDYQSYANGGVLILDGPDKGKLAAPGASAYSGTSPASATNAYRDIFDGHVNLDAWVTQKWEWTSGGHAVNYSDTITAVTGSLGTRYNFNKRWALRANINTGYRPPTLAGLYFSNISSSPGYQSAYEASNGVVAHLLGEEGRKGEYSRSYSLGLDATPLDNFHLVANIYRISINDRLESTTNFGGTAIQNLLASVGVTNVRFVQYYTNPVDTVTNGMDVAATYLWKLRGDENLLFGVSANAADTEISRYRRTPTILASYGQSYYNQYSQNDLLRTSPKNRETMSIAWQKGRYTVSVEELRYGGVIFIVNPTDPSNLWVKVRPQWNTNLSVTMAVTKRFSLSIGANNLFNKYPTRVSALFAAPTGSYRYATYTPGGFMGGCYYARLSYNF